MKNKLKFLTAVVLLVSGVNYAQIGVGTTTPDASSAIEVASTTKGMLIPRMTTTERNAITTPANGLLIYNTSSNNFEVYKTTCSCWITLADGGTTAAQSPVNTAPTATSLNYTGSSIVGKAFTINYVYADAQSDAEGLTTIQWQSATSSGGTSAANISGATSASYTPVIGNVGNWIRAIVTPRAATGILNGVQTFGGWVQVEAATIPTATSLIVNGTVTTGSVLTASYTFSGGSGIENTTPVLGTTYTWQTATTNTGVGIATAPLYGNSSFTNVFTAQADLIGTYIRVGVRAKDNAGVQASNFVYSAWVGPLTGAADTAPVANNVSVSPSTPAIGGTLTGNYVYSDANFDPEGVSTFKWYIADNASGANSAAISGETGLSYIPTLIASNKFIGFGVKPVALTGTNTLGTEVISYTTSAVPFFAQFTFTGTAINQLPFFAANRVMNAQNAISVEINVTSIGSINFSSNTVNGYSFSGSYVATSTGTQWVTVSASGTQSSYNSGGDSFTITGTGLSTHTKSITIIHNIKGADLTSYSNGGSLNENFSSNTWCQSAIVSAGYNSGTCSGSVTVGSNSYNLVHINGQCWMQSNLKEAPTAPCAAAINTGCNILTNNTVDIGSWGYYNTVTTNGTAGWSTTEPAVNEGLLYQYSAAMNGTTYERSQGVCPIGWHIPSDCEWMYLEHGQGMSISQQNATGGRNTTGEGNKIRSVGSGATNSSGFSAIFPGARFTTPFAYRGANGAFWTSSNITRELIAGANIYRSGQPALSALSVRCLKD